MNEIKKKIAVVGAGIAGLTCAYELQKAGHDVTVYEKEDTVGGRMNSRWKDGYPFDIGADHLCNLYKEMKGYCSEFDIAWEKMKFLEYRVIKNKVPVPFTKAVGKIAGLRMAFQYYRTKNVEDFFDLKDAARFDTDNAHDFMLRRVGKEAVDYLVDPFVSTYQFHRSDEISLGALYGILNSIKKDKGVQNWNLHRTKGGMEALPKAFASRLNVKTGVAVKNVEAGEKINLETDGIEEFDTVVLACPSTVTENILQNPTEAQADVIGTTRYSTTMSVALRVPKKLLPDVAIVWVPFVESHAISGYVNESMKGEELVHGDKTLLCTWLHEEFAINLIDKSEKEIFEAVRTEFMKVCPWIKEKNDIEFHDVEIWKDAMPVFAHGHLARVEAFMENGQGNNNVYLCGDYLNSPWTEGALRCGQRVAAQVLEGLSS
ncbi:MAG: FAD-dependent oxidoreductase [bacterium]|nr:FAD-dependent oxidoreductase [bacterium]